MMSKLLGADGDYQPISCARYAEVELAIVRRMKLRILWRNGNVLHYRVVVPYGLRTRANGEFLLCRGDVQGRSRSCASLRPRHLCILHIASPGQRGTRVLTAGDVQATARDGGR